MDMDLDLELELDLDPVEDLVPQNKLESFLQAKWREFEAYNQQLQEQIETDLKLYNEIKPVHRKKLNVGDVQVKTCQEKCVVCFEISSDERVDELQVFLEGDMVYAVKIYQEIEQDCCDNPIKCTDVVCGRVREVVGFTTAMVYITFTPPYVQKALVIGGFVAFTIDGDQFQQPLKAITVQTSLFFKKYSSDFYTQIASNCLTNLVLTLPSTWTASLTRTFEIHCALTLRKYYYVAHNISDHFDGTILIVHPQMTTRDLFMKISHSSTNRLLLIIHYLYGCIEGCKIYPRECYKGGSMEVLKEFKQQLKREVKLMYSFVRRMKLESRGGLFPLDELSEVEKRTDLRYLEAQEMSC